MTSGLGGATSSYLGSLSPERSLLTGQVNRLAAESEPDLERE
jgi:hypothetical protein